MKSEIYTDRASLGRTAYHMP